MKVLGTLGSLVLMVLFLTVIVCYAQDPAEESLIMGVECASQGKFEEAKEYFEEALKIDPFYSSVKLGLRAIEDVLTEKVDRSAAIHLFKAVACLNEGQWNDAMTEIAKAIEMNPGYAAAYNSRGGAYALIGLHEQSLSDFNKALEINPRYAEAYINRGWSFRLKGLYKEAISDFDRAISDYIKAIEINPRYAEAYNNRGAAYAAKGQYGQAISDFDKAIEINSRLARAYYNKAVACEEAGRMRDAVETYRSFLEYASPWDSSRIQHALERIGELER